MPMHPGKLSIRDFTYSLPEDRVAGYPLANRDDSRLLIYRDGKITEDRYKNIAAHIPANSLLVFNNSKVVEARLLFQKPTGGVIEIFCLEPGEQYPDISSAMAQQGKVYWQCLVGGASKWKKGQVLEKTINTGVEDIILSASYAEKKAGSFVIELSWQPSRLSFSEILHLAGAVPLPPYLKRNAEATDTERYQTIYARHDGSVAAPTAGLHFTDAVFKTLEKKNIHTGFITLHVGAGTFKPVKSETMNEHEMHAEFIDVTREAVEHILHHLDDTIVAVGTTSLRTIESLYWLGAKAMDNSKKMAAGGIPTLGQWEAYEMQEQAVSPREALESVLVWMEKNKTGRLLAKTQIIIAPGYGPKIVNALVTNFHQPQSTLLLLVAALIGEQWKSVYEYALQHDFRFLSYGDGSLLWAS
jgi:S-adenosylmethionine:tRNA ribosyltransferase-isomerase